MKPLASFNNNHPSKRSLKPGSQSPESIRDSNESSHTFEGFRALGDVQLAGSAIHRDGASSAASAGAVRSSDRMGAP